MRVVVKVKIIASLKSLQDSFIPRKVAIDLIAKPWWIAEFSYYNNVEVKINTKNWILNEKQYERL